MKKLVVGALVGIALVGGAVALVKKRIAQDRSYPYPPIYPLHLKTILPKTGIVETTLPYIGEVKSGGVVRLSTKFSARVEQIVEEGAKVKEGEVVAKLENSQLHSQLAQLSSQLSSLRQELKADRLSLSNLEKTHKRTSQLLTVGMASVEEFQNEETKIAQLKAKIAGELEKIRSLQSQLRAIKEELTYTLLKSPVDGVVSKKVVNRGDLAIPGKPIVEITPSAPSLYLILPLPFTPKGVIVKGRQLKAIPLNTTQNGLPLYRVNLPMAGFLPGELIKVKVVTYRGKGSLLPFSAILSIDGKSYIFPVKNGKVEVRRVKIVATGTEGVVISPPTSSPLLVAPPDILLKVKGGYPVVVEKGNDV